MKAGRPPDVPMYQLTVTLLEVKPAVWRRLALRSDTRLGKLHRILQVVLGWTDSHLHEYVVGDIRYGVPDPEYDDRAVRSERTVPLYQVLLAPKATCIYEYDFGDGWNHELVLEQVVAPMADTPYPMCLAGQRACPPEDVGGVGGYAEFLKAIRSPRHPEHAEMLTWAGGQFDPDAFDLDEVNRRLARLR